MCEAQNMSVKAYLLTELDETQEVRRFGIPEGASTSYNYLEERIKNVFSLGSEHIKVYWQDFEGDYISISSDEELLTAIAECTTSKEQQVLRIYVKLSDSGNKKGKGQASEKNLQHVGITCDGCNGGVYGIRYKCKTCWDFDLCSYCKGKGIHKQHEFILIDKPGFFGFPKNAHAAGEKPEEGGWRRGGHGNGRGYARGEWWRPAGHQVPTNGPHGHHQSGSNGGPNPAHFSFHTSASAGGVPFTATYVPAYGPYPPPPFPPPFPVPNPAMAEEAGKFAHDFASKHMADIMKGIWTGWSGSQKSSEKEQASATSTEANAEETPNTENKDQEKENSATGPRVVNIDICMEEPSSPKEAEPTPPKEAEGTSTTAPEASVSSTAERNDQRDSSSPEVVLIDAVDRMQGSPVNWTLLDFAAGGTEEIQEVSKSTDATTPSSCIPPPKAAAPPPPPPSQPTAPHPNERVRSALEQMQAMGYSDEGGWLSRLLEMKEGDINQVLDILLVQRK